MAELSSTPSLPTPAPVWSTQKVLLALFPLLGLAVVIALIFLTGTGLGTNNLPPLEELTIQRVLLPEQGVIRLELINGGPEAVTVAQVIVDDAFWQYTITPAATIPRLGQATVEIPYPWVQNEVHAITLLTSTGLTFNAEIPVAVQSPAVTPLRIWQYALLGIYVGVVPVALGLAWHPLLRQIGRRGLNVVLSLTVGLLLFLFVDTLLAALEVAATLPGVFAGAPLVWLLTLLTVLGLQAIGTGGPQQSRLGLSTMIALGIGLHNLGEGLAIGAALAAGQAALGAFLVIGFTLHNVTEGVGIAAPIANDRPRWWQFVGLGLLAGAPAILGTWIGGFAYSPLFSAIFLAIGSGAILQVIYAVGRLVLNDARRHQEPLIGWHTLAGLTLGLAIMYSTALLVTA